MAGYSHCFDGAARPYFGPKKLMEKYFYPLASPGRLGLCRACLNALLVLLFTYAAASKLIPYDEFRRQMLSQPLPHAVDLAIYHLLPPAEALTAALLIMPRTNRWGLRLALALLAAFTGYVALVMLHFWQHVPCSCGGILGKLGWGPHLALNAVFFLITLVSIYLERKERRAGEN